MIVEDSLEPFADQGVRAEQPQRRQRGTLLHETGPLGDRKEPRTAILPRDARQGQRCVVTRKLAENIRGAIRHPHGRMKEEDNLRQPLEE